MALKHASITQQRVSRLLTIHNRRQNLPCMNKNPLSRRNFLSRMAQLCLTATTGLAAHPAATAFTAPYAGKPKETVMKLPLPALDGSVSVEQAIQKRRTKRAYAATPLSMAMLSQLLWAAQGVTEDGGFKRAAPSGGACYPMDIYAIVGHEKITSLAAGIVRYRPTDHSLSIWQKKDLREPIARAALHQRWMAQAPIQLVIVAEYARITAKYGQRGIQYAWIEAGHIGQNIFLQAEALGLVAGIVGAFDDEQIAKIMRLPPATHPLLVMPVGCPG